MTASEAMSSLAAALGPNASKYWEILSHYLRGKLARIEFERDVRQYITNDQLTQMHNNLLLEIISGATVMVEPDTIPTNTIIPAHKRQRIHPYQGNVDDQDTLHSARMKQWLVSLNKAERESIKARAAQIEGHPSASRTDYDESRQPPSFQHSQPKNSQRLVVTMCTDNRMIPTLHQLAERVYSVAIQHGVNFPSSTSRQYVTLLATALEEHLLTVLRQTISTIASSEAYQPEPQHSFRTPLSRMITMPALATTLSITPSLVPHASPAVQRLLTTEYIWPHVTKEDTQQKKSQKPVLLNQSPVADFYRLVRVSRSGGPTTLQDFAFVG